MSHHPPGVLSKVIAKRLGHQKAQSGRGAHVHCVASSAEALNAHLSKGFVGFIALSACRS